jgi:uncharacterized membrane protein
LHFYLFPCSAFSRRTSSVRLVNQPEKAAAAKPMVAVALTGPMATFQINVYNEKFTSFS